MITSIRFDHRVLFCGKTRSGKTYLASKLTSKLPRLLVFALPGRFNLHKASDEEIEEFCRGGDLRIRVEDADTFDEIVTRTFDDGYYTVYVDELYQLVPNPARIPRSVTMLWTRGGGNHIGAWASVQRPTRIPLFVITELEHMFVFRLKSRDDRRRAWDFAGMDELPDVPREDEHGFYYYNDFNSEVLYVRSFE